jgi:hypothetical protein
LFINNLEGKCPSTAKKLLKTRADFDRVKCRLWHEVAPLLIAWRVSSHGRALPQGGGAMPAVEDYHALKPYNLTHSEAMFVIHLMVSDQL